MTRVLFVINTMGMGGAERALVALMRALPQDAEISLLSLINRGELFLEVPARVRILNPRPDAGSVLDAQGRRALRRAALGALAHKGAAITRLPYLLRNLAAQRRAGRVQPDKLLWRLIADAAPRFDERYDLAVAYLEGGATYYVAAHVKAARKAAFVHIDYRQAGYTRLTDGNAYAAMDRVYVVSRETGEHFLETYPELRDKVRVFNNLIDVARIRRLAEEGEGFTDDYRGTRLLTVGRLHPQKGYDIAIPAMRRLVDAGVDARWYVLGEGAERANLERLIARYGLNDRFVLLGARVNPYPFLRQADVYVHATRFEGKSIAIEEAQVLGKPIIATDCAGNREQITSGVDGLLIQLSEDNLSAALRDALAHPERLAAWSRAAALRQTGEQKDVNAFFAFARGEETPC